MADDKNQDAAAIQKFGEYTRSGQIMKAVVGTTRSSTAS